MENENTSDNIANVQPLENTQPWWQRFKSGLNEFYHAPYRQTMARAARDERGSYASSAPTCRVGPRRTG